MSKSARIGQAVSLRSDLPEVLREVRTRSLFVMRLDVRPLQIIGNASGAYRRVGVVAGGAFEGERLSGTVLDGGADWQNVRTDGSVTLDVRLVLKTADDALIGMTYRGFRHGPAPVIERLNRGDAVDASEYYFRTAAFFETSSAKYGWLNRIVAVATGHRPPAGLLYEVFEVL